jgi:hypothetical protein
MTSQAIVCAQIGAREHYAIPRALSRLGRLDALITDVWASPRWRAPLAGIQAGRRLATRWHAEIPGHRVVDFTGSALLDAAIRLWRRPRCTEQVVLQYLRTGERFARNTRSYLCKRAKSSGAPCAFFSYTTGALEALDYLNDCGVPTIVDQIDPARLEDEINFREAAEWRGWAAVDGRIPEVYFERLEAEWQRATLIVVNSEWSRSSLEKQGVPSEKLRVLPLAYDAPVVAHRTKSLQSEKTVLWLGQVVLRKGIQYLMSAARMLQRERLRFVVAGPIGISKEAIRSAPSNMSFLGPVTRDRVSSLYQSADLFVFPTLSDGFGVTQLEAMAHGLPVIATRNCGAVVEHGVNGLIVPASDPHALAAAIMELAFDPQRLESMSLASIETARSYSVQALSVRLQSVLNELPERRHAP